MGGEQITESPIGGKTSSRDWGSYEKLRKAGWPQTAVAAKCSAVGAPFLSAQFAKLIVGAADR
jgi:hypothetical protein